MTHTGDGFGDTIWARLIALAIAGAVAVALYLSWGAEVAAILDTGQIAALPTGDAPEVKPQNPALDACLSKRLGDVDQMLADGVIGEAQARDFKSRAQALCIDQNPL